MIPRALGLALVACAPDPLSGDWRCEPGGDRLVDGERVACPVDGLSWALTIPDDDGEGLWVERDEDGEQEHLANATRLDVGAWAIDAPTYRCPGCDVTGLADGLALSCVLRATEPPLAHCGGVDGGGNGWDLRLAR